MFLYQFIFFGCFGDLVDSGFMAIVLLIFGLFFDAISLKEKLGHFTKLLVLGLVNILLVLLI